MIKDLNTMIENQVESIRDLEVSNICMKNELKDVIFLFQELKD